MHDRLQQALHSLTSTPILMYAAIVQRLNLLRINSPKCGGHLKRNVYFLNSWCKHTMSFFTSATAQQTEVVHCNNETRQRPSPRRAPQRFILRTRPVQQTAVGIHRPPPASTSSCFHSSSGSSCPLRIWSQADGANHTIPDDSRPRRASLSLFSVCSTSSSFSHYSPQGLLYPCR